MKPPKAIRSLSQVRILTLVCGRIGAAEEIRREGTGSSRDLASAGADSVCHFQSAFGKANTRCVSFGGQATSRKSPGSAKPGPQNGVKRPRRLWKGHPRRGLVLPALAPPGWAGRPSREARGAGLRGSRGAGRPRHTRCGVH